MTPPPTVCDAFLSFVGNPVSQPVKRTCSYAISLVLLRPSQPCWLAGTRDTKPLRTSSSYCYRARNKPNFPNHSSAYKHMYKRRLFPPCHATPLAQQTKKYTHTHAPHTNTHNPPQHLRIFRQCPVTIHSSRNDSLSRNQPIWHRIFFETLS
jgi:hypothetical protein